MTSIQINEELRTYIEPLTSDELEALERSLLAEGCRDALVLWGDVLVDGHNRYAICTKHGIPFKTVQNPRFKSMDDVRLWMIENHLGRRSVSDFQRGVLALRKKEILEQRAREAQEQANALAAQAEAESSLPPANIEPVTIPNRQTLARAARLSSNTLGQIERIQKAAAPEVVRAVQSGEISINAAAAVAALPVDQQVSAAAEGRKALKELARQAREAKLRAKPTPEGEQTPEPPVEEIEDYPAEVLRLRELVKALTHERDALKKKVMQLTVALSEARRD
ncbi:hypothetical protein [Bordetella sp. 02P26C-1]|uniref:hypothetical protein n=1 Tax=Bordetella sp. 02P26C-1 TaxID=2683195 RepID=UPI0013561A23|nr:hypothetical protein [Bordetella sp. 02P26C-1]MVW78772.1 hypothetical protein [Bordetella sp. 02P26C-1]